MPQVTLSDAVLAEIWKRANPRPFENLTPEVGLRRMFNMPMVGAADGEQVPREDSAATRPLHSSHSTSGRKAPKASLEALKTAGLIRQGETLSLVDYQRNRVVGVEATVQGALLLCAGESGTMSFLAQKQLSKRGYKSRSVRGPAHWVNSKGQSVLQLWEEYRNGGNRQN